MDGWAVGDCNGWVEVEALTRWRWNEQLQIQYAWVKPRLINRMGVGDFSLDREIVNNILHTGYMVNGCENVFIPPALTGNLLSWLANLLWTSQLWTHILCSELFATIRRHQPSGKSAIKSITEGQRRLKPYPALIRFCRFFWMLNICYFGALTGELHINASSRLCLRHCAGIRVGLICKIIIIHF